MEPVNLEPQNRVVKFDNLSLLLSKSMETQQTKTDMSTHQTSSSSLTIILCDFALVSICAFTSCTRIIRNNSLNKLKDYKSYLYKKSLQTKIRNMKTIHRLNLRQSWEFQSFLLFLESSAFVLGWWCISCIWNCRHMISSLWTTFLGHIESFQLLLALNGLKDLLSNVLS